MEDSATKDRGQAHTHSVLRELIPSPPARTHHHIHTHKYTRTHTLSLSLSCTSSIFNASSIYAVNARPTEKDSDSVVAKLAQTHLNR